MLYVLYQVMKFIEYYKKGLIVQNQKNIKDVKDTAKRLLCGTQKKADVWLLTKIKNHLERYVISDSVNDILSKVSTDEYLASMFAKEASKQNMSEILQKKYLSIRKIIVDKLPGNGNKAIRLLEGELIYGNDRGGKATKSMDFKKNEEFIFAKVTTGGGGGQDNQYRDVIDFLTEAGKYDKKYGDKKFTALVDGDYYTEEKLKTLKKFKTKNIRITSSDEF